MFTAERLILTLGASGLALFVVGMLVAGLFLPGSKSYTPPYEVGPVVFAQEALTAQLDAMGTEVMFGPKTRLVSDNGRGVVHVHLDVHPVDLQIPPYGVDVTMERTPWFIEDVTPRVR